MKAMLHVLHVVGARPNFPKVAPIMRVMARQPAVFRQTLVHTGQHYDQQMSQVFFRDLQLPQPDVFLGIGAGTHAQQTARIMLAFEEVLQHRRPDLVIVVGDVNSTLACALVCAKLGVRLAHVEAGLRAGDRTMPEEINRVLTDQLADLLFTPSPDADANLLREGIPAERIHCVGNVMIDSLQQALPLAAQRPILAQLALQPHAYGLVTLHRPANVDDPAVLQRLLTALEQIGRELPLIFPVHPRTRQRLAEVIAPSAGLRLIDPLGYLDCLQLTRHARLVLTDSGGLQEESSVLGVPCLTLRSTTERPITVTHGTNRVVGTQPDAILAAAADVLSRPLPAPARIPGWDGHAAERVVEVLLRERITTAL